MKLYIAVLDEVPDFITPTLVAHAVLGAHLAFSENTSYRAWLKDSFKKCVGREGQQRIPLRIPREDRMENPCRDRSRGKVLDIRPGRC